MDDEKFMEMLRMLDDESKHESSEIKELVASVVKTYRVDDKSSVSIA